MTAEPADQQLYERAMRMLCIDMQDDACAAAVTHTAATRVAAAVQLIRDSALTDPRAAAFLSWCLSRPFGGLNADPTEAVRILEWAAIDQRNPVAVLMMCLREDLGMQGRVSADLLVQSWSTLTEAKTEPPPWDVFALHIRCFAREKGLPGCAEPDPIRAVHELQAIARRGFALSQRYLGWCYSFGRGVAQDHAQAMRWHELAAAQGYAPAQTSLGWCYECGLGRQKDAQLAQHWYRLAAERGYTQAREALRRLADASAQS